MNRNIDALFPPKKWQKSFKEKVKIDFTFHSNKIEGNAISYGQTLLFLKNAVRPKDVSIKDCLDIDNHYRIISKIFESYNNDFSPDYIIGLHSELMKNQIQWGDDVIYSPGEFKTGYNYGYTQDGKEKRFMAPYRIDHEMKILCNQINEKIRHKDINSIEKHPLFTATIFHNRFICEMHPFEDGNGRVGRICFNQILLKTGLSPIDFNVDRKKYINLCHEATANNMNPAMNYFSDLLIKALEEKKKQILNFINLTKKLRKSSKRS